MSRISLSSLPDAVLEAIIENVDQFDLINLCTVNSRLNQIASNRLYKRVTIILKPEFPTRFNRDSKRYIRENGLKYMDTSLILSFENLVRFNQTVLANPLLIDKIKFFIFDKCETSITSMSGDSTAHSNIISQEMLNSTHSEIVDLFGKHSDSINFLHITFVDFFNGVMKLNKFLSNDNVRNKLFKLLINKLDELYTPRLPPGLTNLFLLLDEIELSRTQIIDLGVGGNFEILNSLQTLTFSTTQHLGLDIIRKLELRFNEKLRLRGLTIFHCHKEVGPLQDSYTDAAVEVDGELESASGSTSYIKSIDKNLDFMTISAKIDLNYLSQLFLKIDCFIDSRNESHGDNGCNCFPKFFQDLTNYLVTHSGLPNLQIFELELFPNLEWLRPHQILEGILTPLGTFIKTLSSLTKLSIDFSTLGFKMFDNGMGMSSELLNKLNERLMQAFFLCFFSTITQSTEAQSSNYQTESYLGVVISNLRTLQLPDFLTSFIYYKPDFYESFLHTCKCRGCYKVLRMLQEQFYPLNEEDNESDDNEVETGDGDNEGKLDLQSSYYLLIGFILGKLQADREVCIPIKKSASNYRQYPIYKGQLHTLHHQFHLNDNCKCSTRPEDDPSGTSPLNIDNLVTTYIIHQLRPIVKYLSKIFQKLDNLMIHGIYYEMSPEGIMKPIFDDEAYPFGFERFQVDPIPDLPFGCYKKIL